MWISDLRKPSPLLTGFVSAWQSQALRILLSFLIFFLTLLPSSLLSLLDSPPPVWSYNYHLSSLWLGLCYLFLFPSLTAGHRVPQSQTNPALSFIHRQCSPSKKAGLVSTPTLVPGHSMAEVKTLPMYGFWPEKTDIPFYRHPPLCKIPRDLGLDLLVILMPGGGIWVLVKNSWYLLRRAIENWSQHLALWPRLLNPLRV